MILSNNFHFLPNILIKKVLYDESRINVEMVLKKEFIDRFEGTIFGDWVNAINFVILESRNAAYTDRLLKSPNICFELQGIKEEIRNQTPLAVANDPVQEVLSERVFRFSDFRGSMNDLAGQFYEEIGPNGNKITNFIFQQQYEPTTVSYSNPEHLAYIVFSKLNLSEAEMFSHFQFTPEIMSIIPTERTVGKVSSEIVFQRGEINSNSSVFTDSENNIWAGDVHKMKNGQWMSEKFHNINSRILTKKTVPNSKIIDSRVIDHCSFRQSGFIITKNKEQVVKNSRSGSPIYDQPEIYFSDSYLSRDKVGSSRFLFSLDFKKMIQEKSSIGGSFLKEESLQDIIRDTKIFSTKIFRSRVQGSSKSGSDVKGDKKFDDNQIDPLIIETGPELSADTSNGSIREINIFDGSSKQNLNFRYFTGIDKLASNLSDGYYQYRIEMMVEDGVKKFLNQHYTLLESQKNSLLTYFDDAMKKGSPGAESLYTDSSLANQNSNKQEVDQEKPGSYDARGARFTHSFILKYMNPNNWVWEDPINTYVKILFLLTEQGESFSNINFDSKYVSKHLKLMCHPKTGSPQDIKQVIDLIQALQDIILAAIENKEQSSLMTLTPTDSSNKKSGKKMGTNKNIIDLKNTFNSVFNAGVDSGVGTDFLGPSLETEIGLEIYNNNEWQRRIKTEQNKWWNPAQQSKSISFSFGDFTINDSNDSTSFSYLTPLFIAPQINAEVCMTDNTSAIDYTKLYFDSVKTVNQFFQKSPVNSIENKTDTSIEKGINSLNKDIGSFLSSYMGVTLKKSLLVTTDKKTSASSTSTEVDTTDDWWSGGASGNSSDDQKRITGDSVKDETTNAEKATKLSGQTTNVNLVPLFAKMIQDKILILPSSNAKNNSAVPLANASNSAKSLKYTDLNINSENNIFQKEKTSNKCSIASPESDVEVNPQFKKRIANLPNSIKALTMSYQNTDVLSSEIKDLILDNNDPVSNPKTSSKVKLKFLNIKRVEAFTGFTNSLSNLPNWVLLTEEVYKNANGEFLLCRLRDYEDSSLYIEVDKGAQIPAFNEYFILSTNETNSVELEPFATVPFSGISEPENEITKVTYDVNPENTQAASVPETSSNGSEKTSLSSMKYIDTSKLNKKTSSQQPLNTVTTKATTAKGGYE